jgi:hypothetical protein
MKQGAPQQSRYSDSTPFYKELKAFLKALITVFPQDREIKMISSSLNIAMMDDPDAQIIKTYYKLVHPYANLIDGRDPLFFTQDPQNFFQNSKDVNPHQYNIFAKLNMYWSELTAENQGIVWEYVDVLYTLAKGVAGA